MLYNVMIKIFMLFRENKNISVFYLRVNILTEMLRKTNRHTKLPQTLQR